MSEVIEESGVAVAVEQPPITAVGVKSSSKKKSGDLIADIAQEVEQMSKTKALNEADRLAENIETDYFRLGGVLKVINDNSWFEGYPDLDTFVYEKYGFQGRKARYLMQIYSDLVTKAIPWNKVAHLGWTKLKDLSPILTLENLDEWVAKAENLTVAELQAALKAKDGGNEGSDVSGATKSDVVKIKFDLKTDQAEMVKQALAKAKGESGTEFDTVALENICAAYLSGSVNMPVTTPEAFLSSFFANDSSKERLIALLTPLSNLFPQFDINVESAAPATL